MRINNSAYVIRPNFRDTITRAHPIAFTHAQAMADKPDQKPKTVTKPAAKRAPARKSAARAKSPRGESVESAAEKPKRSRARAKPVQPAPWDDDSDKQSPRGDSPRSTVSDQIRSPRVKSAVKGGFRIEGEEGTFFDPDNWEAVGDAAVRKDASDETKEKLKGVKHSYHQKNDPSSDEEDEETPRDVRTGGRLPPVEFRDPEFGRIFMALIDEYATYRAYAVAARVAFLRVFGTGYADVLLEDRIEALEHNVVFRAIFARRFEAVKVGEMWSLKQSVFELMALVNHPYTKETVKYAAIKELNVIYGITMIDDQGRSVKGKSLKDFYQEQVPNSPVVSQAIAAHPLPGSPESDAFLKANAAPTRQD